jgi:rubrerythrin
MMKDFQTVEDVLKFAITLEQASQNFYRRLAEQTESPSVRHFLLEMVAEETAHEKQLRDMITGGWQILVQEISSEDMDRYIDAMTIPEPLDYKEAVKIARDKEKASRMLYSLLSGVTDHPGVTGILRKLALQEQGHYQFFEQEYRRICVSEN